jgi:glycosyltransferase involved in cell wall biosynthesis
VRTVSPRPLGRRPTVSVVVPCYNYGHYLDVAVGSVLAQPGVDVEVIVVDDASPDGSLRVAHAIAEREPRVQVVGHEQNMGHIATYNDGLARVTGDYVVLLSADDALAPGSLERSTALLEAFPELGLVYGFAPTFEDRFPSARSVVRNWSVWQGEEWIERLCRRGRNIILNPEAILRRSLMDELGGYVPTLPHSADMHLWMCAAARAGVGRVNGADQAFYRVHGSNMHLTDFGGQMADMVEVRRTFEEFFADERARLARPGQLHATARRAMAAEAMRLASLLLDEGGDVERADGFARFAVATDADVESSAAWRRYRLRKRRPTGLIRREVSTRADDLLWAVRWRRWRRYGV